MAETTLNTIPTEGPVLIAADIRSSAFLKRRWLYHSLFWVLYYGLTITLYHSLREKISFMIYVTTALLVIIEAGCCYLNTYLLIPRFLFTRRYGLYALTLLPVLLVCPWITGGLEYIFIKIYEPEALSKMHFFTFGGWIVGIIQCIYIVGLVAGIKFVKDTLINQQLQKEKEKHYLETELKFLRAQIQPHFFFNTLNNIYSLTLKQSPQAPDVVLKLSDLMSYMLYESTAPHVPLSKEIDYLQNYLDIEQLRFGNRITIDFLIEGNTTGAQIPPMILILFLENSFKHGVKNNISHILLTIRLKVGKDHLIFHIENPTPEEEAGPNTKGIGLKNVRRRLDLLYNDQYTLDIREANKIFTVTLTMPLC